jgi:hypothetical protein
MRAPLLLALSVCLAACTTQSTSAKAPDPAAILQALAPADAARFDHVRSMKDWRNPYLIVRSDGVALYDTADSAELTVKPQDVITELARLPVADWPYGRVVAATETTATNDEEGVAIRRNKGIVGGMLADAHVTIKWVPGS